MKTHNALIDKVVGIDAIIYFFLKGRPELIAKFTKENSIVLRKFILKNKLRRAMVKLKFLTTLIKVV